MSGRSYASFTFAEPQNLGAVRDVSWQSGRLGYEAATCFPEESRARLAASQVLGADGPPTVVRLND